MFALVTLRCHRIYIWERNFYFIEWNMDFVMRDSIIYALCLHLFLRDLNVLMRMPAIVGKQLLVVKGDFDIAATNLDIVVWDLTIVGWKTNIVKGDFWIVKCWLNIVATRLNIVM